MKLSRPVQVVLVLPLTAGGVFAQVKPANLDPDAWYSIIALPRGKAMETAGGVDGKANRPQLP